MRLLPILGLTFTAAACGPAGSPTAIDAPGEDGALDEDHLGVVAELDPGSRARTTGHLNLRRGPDTTYGVLAVMPAGAEVSVQDRSGRWYHVEWAGLLGWASGLYLEPVLEASPPDPPPPPADVEQGWWRPSPGTSWQWQLTGTIDTSLDVAMYDVDLFDAPQAVIDRLKAEGRTVICYFSAGSHEDFRADAGRFPAGAIGSALDDWPGERWVDIRSAGVRAIMSARLDLAVARGCDGVEPDNVDGYANASGFSLRPSDQLDYNRFLAREAHQRGLSVGLKNDLDQVEALVGDFDWALNEECAAYDECDALLPFIAAGKAVFHVEYGGDDAVAGACRAGGARGFDTLVKRLDLDAWRRACN